MSLRCRIFGHKWDVHGGVAAGVAGDDAPPNVAYACDVCGERRTIWGIDVSLVANSPKLMRDPDAVDRMSHPTNIEQEADR